MGGITFLPFVRDSRTAPGGGKPTSAPPVAAKVTTAAPTEKSSQIEKKEDSIVLSVEGESLRVAIDQLGLQIREKKTAKVLFYLCRFYLT